MIEVRPFATLGAADHGWLDARHHFSFAGYHDPQRMGWGAIRVWNDDAIAGRSGFPPHAHSDMEIITYVRDGAITHRDSLGNHGRTGAGDVQVMSAGSGVTHAEWNMEDETTRIFQIWILPDRRGGAPDWGARPFPKDARASRFVTLASGMARDVAPGGPGVGDDAARPLPIRADACVAGATIRAGDSVTWDTAADRHVYLVPATGRIAVGGQAAGARDGVAITGEDSITITAIEDAEVVLVDAP